MIVAHISIKATNICKEMLILLRSHSILECTKFEFLEVFIFEESQEYAEKSWCFVADLVRHHLTSFPRSFGHVVCVVSLLFSEIFPRFRVAQVLDTRVCLDEL